MAKLVGRLVRWGLTRNPVRTCFLLLTVIAILVSLAVTGRMMDSLANRSIESWRAVPYDLCITGAGVDDLQGRVTALEGVRRVERAIMFSAMLGARHAPFAVTGANSTLLKLSYLDGRAPVNGEEIAISSSLALSARVGDAIQLALFSQPEKVTSFRVCGIVESELGHSVLNEAGAARIEQQLTRQPSLLVLLAPSASAATIERSIKAMATSLKVENLNEAQNYSGVMNIAEKRIGVTRGLLLAAGMGTLYMLLVLSQRERARELGVLRAIGFGQLRMVLVLLVEGSCLVLLGVLLALFGSLLLTSLLKLGNWRTLLKENVSVAAIVFILAACANFLAMLSVLRRPVTALIKD